MACRTVAMVLTNTTVETQYSCVEVAHPYHDIIVSMFSHFALLQHREMKASHAKALLILCKEHFQMELDVEARHHEIMYDVLHTIMEADHAR